MKLNPEQQTIVESLITSANKLANKYCPGDEEAYSVAYLALCEAVTRYADGPATIQTYCLRWVERAVKNRMGEKTGLRKKSDDTFLTLSSDVCSRDTGSEWFEIEDLLTVLRPSDREVFSRKVFNNTPVSVLAKERGCSIQTIYNILARCKARLRREIDGEPRSNTSGRM